MAGTELTERMGKNIRKYRESIGKSRPIFAAACGISPHTLQGYESGNKCPNMTRFLDICYGSKVSPNRLLSELYTWKTEIDTLQELSAITQRLSDAQRAKLAGLQDIYLKYTLEAHPWLEGAPLGVRIHLLRQDINMDIASLAKLCMVSKPTLQGWESGQYDPSITGLLSLCRVFEVSPEYMLTTPTVTQVYQDARIVGLRPRQIKAFVDMSRYFCSCL